MSQRESVPPSPANDLVGRPIAHGHAGALPADAWPIVAPDRPGTPWDSATSPGVAWRHRTASDAMSIRRGGYILLVILTIMLVIAILGFSLNFFKRGAIEQLSKTVDQNRLMLVAQSAASEVIARLKLDANRPNTDSYRAFRAVLRLAGTPTLPHTETLSFDIAKMPVTRELISIEAMRHYDITVNCRARVVTTTKISRTGFPVYLGFLDVLATVKNRQNVTFELHERREIRQQDMRDFFDKYALYVKDYSRDVNHPFRRLVIEPLAGNLNGGTPEAVTVSRVYLGARRLSIYGAKPPQTYYLDLCFNNGNPSDHATHGQELIKKLFGDSTPKVLTPVHTKPGGQELQTDKATDKYNTPTPTKAFYVAPSKSFPSIPTTSARELWDYPEVHRLYNNQVIAAARQAQQTGGNNDVTNSMADYIMADYNQKYVPGNYANAVVFQAVVSTFYNNWFYRFGYFTADALYEFNDDPNQTRWTQFISSTGHYRGISSFPVDAPDYNTQPWFNPDCQLVGRMGCLFGPDGNGKVLIEGNVMLRFFKLAFYDMFTTNLQRCVPANFNANVTVEFPVPETPLYFGWKQRGAANNVVAQMLSKDRPVDAVNGPLLNSGELECPLMSRPVDTIPANRILAAHAQSIWVREGGSPPQDRQYKPKTEGPILKPSSKGGAEGDFFFPSVCDEVFTQHYLTGADFARHNVRNGIMWVDGRVRINQGPLDLKALGVTKYRGNGMLFVQRGNVVLGSLAADRRAGEPYARLRIFVQDGTIDVRDDSAVIEASLIAMYWPSPPPAGHVGKLRVDGLSRVTIKGNLCVDYLELEKMATNGTLTIQHTVDCYNCDAGPGSSLMDPFRISVAPTRTAFAVNAGDVTATTP